MRRTIVAVLVALAMFTLAPPGAGPRAGAAPIDHGRHETTSGTIHCTVDRNHLLCERFGSTGARTHRAVLELWLPEFCAAYRIIPGSTARRLPARFYLDSRLTGYGCVPGVAQSTSRGWCAYTGSNPNFSCAAYEGANVFDPALVQQGSRTAVPIHHGWQFGAWVAIG